MKAREGSFLDRRRAGILLHPTSLPGTQKGDLGSNAFRFIDFLVESGISVWQTLPLVPTHSDNSPYYGLSSHAGNPSLINLDLLVEEGLIQPVEAGAGQVDFKKFHEAQLCVAKGSFFEMASDEDMNEYTGFIEKHASWLPDFSLYMSLRKKFNMSWTGWPEEWRDRKILPEEIDNKTYKDVFEDMQQCLFEQFVFFRQWHGLRKYANSHDVLLFGDIPIFVAHDSADVWSRREQFLLDETGRPVVVAGVPPDYFSETGQLWGNPLYDWGTMRDDGFAWWIERMRTQLELYDLVRIDHFRGFQAYWEIQSGAETAIDGRWVEAPGDELFIELKNILGEIPFVAEDLGLITPEVTAMRQQYGFPGMKILQFAFDGSEDNPYLPANHEVNSVVYTGTHDNDTSLGWYQLLPADIRSRVDNSMGGELDDMPWPFIRLALDSVADLVMLPLQDVLCLGSESRMNVPGTVTESNWQWQFSWGQITPGLEEKIHSLVKTASRL